MSQGETKQKAPSFPFYVRDWLSDGALQKCQASTRGIWANALCIMWLEAERGKLVIKLEDFGRVLNCTAAERDIFVTDAETHKFCNMERSPEGVLTIVSRRMRRDCMSAASKTVRRYAHDDRGAGPHGASGQTDEATPSREMRQDGAVTAAADNNTSYTSSSSSAPLSSCANASSRQEDGKSFSAQEAARKTKLCETAQRIAGKLYGAGYAREKEAIAFLPYIFKVTRLVNEGLVPIDRVLAAGRDAFDGHRAGVIKHRGAWFTKVVDAIVREAQSAGAQRVDGPVGEGFSAALSQEAEGVDGAAAGAAPEAESSGSPSRKEE